MISNLAMVALPALSESSTSNFFALNAHDPRVLLAASVGVGLLQWLKWKSDPRTRKKDNWRMVGDIGLAMSLIFLVSALLAVLGWLNMPTLVIATVLLGFMGKDFLDKEEQKKTKTWFWSLVRQRADSALEQKGDDQP